MAQVTAIGQPVNDAERRAIAHLRDHLPAEYRVVHNFELPHEGRWFEVDLAVIAPHAVYLVDVKGTYGEVHVAAGQWHPRGRAPFASPLPRLRGHAKRLKELIVGTPPRPDLGRIWVEPLVLLTAPDAYLVDPAERDRPSVVALADCARRFQDPAKLPVEKSEDTRRHVGAILGAIQGKARPSRPRSPSTLIPSSTAPSPSSPPPCRLNLSASGSGPRPGPGRPCRNRPGPPPGARAPPARPP